MADEVKTENSDPTKGQSLESTQASTSSPPGSESSSAGSVEATTQKSTLQKIEEGALPTEAIDAEIMKADPLLMTEFAEIQKIKTEESVAIESYDPEQELNAYLKDLKESRGFKKWLYRVFPFIPKLIKYLALAKIKLKSFLIHAVTVLLPLALVFLKNQILWILGLLKKVLQAFSAKTTAQKLGIVFFILFTTMASYAIWFIWVKKPLDHAEGLFVNSLEELSNATYKYDQKTEVEPFYGNYRVSQNILTIPRMVVNLRPSLNSGPNPMGAVELFIEGGSPEVVVEIKDREAEMKDAMQRVMEEMTFDELISPEGKPALAEKIRKELNRIVTKGKVRRVFMKEAIFKP